MVENDSIKSSEVFAILQTVHYIVIQSEMYLYEPV